MHRDLLRDRELDLLIGLAIDAAPSAMAMMVRKKRKKKRIDWDRLVFLGLERLRDSPLLELIGAI
jgi:hypothetical protein